VHNIKVEACEFLNAEITNRDDIFERERAFNICKRLLLVQLESGAAPRHDAAAEADVPSRARHARDALQKRAESEFGATHRQQAAAAAARRSACIARRHYNSHALYNDFMSLMDGSDLDKAKVGDDAYESHMIKE
jgi:hypothetical protein